MPCYAEMTEDEKHWDSLQVFWLSFEGDEDKDLPRHVYKRDIDAAGWAVREINRLREEVKQLNG